MQLFVSLSFIPPIPLLAEGIEVMQLLGLLDHTNVDPGTSDVGLYATFSPEQIFFNRELVITGILLTVMVIL
jgi:hypothetical protein